MITINNPFPPLELAISANDILNASLKEHNACSIEQKTTYSYDKTLRINEAVGGLSLKIETLLYYPFLCQNLRKIKQLSYDTEIRLADIPCLKENGIEAIAASFAAINDKLKSAKEEKARLDAQFYNLVHLYGQSTTPPVIQSIKPLFVNSYRGMQVLGFRIKISGVRYNLWTSYNSPRLRTNSLCNLSCYDLLRQYFKNTRNDLKAISYQMRIHFAGAFINTPIVIFRATTANNYKSKGKHYYVDLNTFETWTRKEEAKSAAKKYHPEINLMTCE